MFFFFLNLNFESNYSMNLNFGPPMNVILRFYSKCMGGISYMTKYADTKCFQNSIIFF